MADIYETVPFDFDELYTATKLKFEEKGYDTSEGSNTSQLITAMAYLTSMLNINTAVNINETILPLARKLDNAKRSARMLGYEIAHKQSYKYRLTIDLEPGIHIIPKYTPFTAEGKTYYYMGNRLEFNNTGPGNLSIELDVKEGTLYKFSDYPATLVSTTIDTTDSLGNVVPQYYLDIPYVDVENDGLEVFLTYYDVNGNLYTQEKWNETNQFMIDKDSVLNKEYIRMDDIEYHTPRIYFKLGGVGTGIRAGTIIEVNVLTTSGTSGGLSSIADPSIFSFSLGTGVTITAISLLLQGTDEESLTSIKENAPLFHNSANRVITKDDYTAFCNRHQSVNTSMVWGGDDEFPKSPGHVWFSFLPSTNIRTFTSDSFNTSYTLDDPTDLVNWYVENSEIRSSEYNISGDLINPGVWDELDNYKVPTLSFHNRHPIYLDFKYSFEILKYDIKTSKADINQSIFDVVDNTFTGSDDVITLEGFEKEYFHSNVEKRIDQDLTDVTGFNSTLITQLMITEKNISSELGNDSYRDIYIPLSVPFETYFDINDDLIISKLPSIDTTAFADEYNLRTDWTGVNGVASDAIITAPIYAAASETFTATVDSTTVIPLSVIGFGAGFANIDANHALMNLIVKVDGVPTVNFNVTGATEITLVTPINTGSTVEVSVDSLSGYYYLFNDYRKYIIVQLFVNAEGYVPGAVGDSLFTEPKTYLTTVDGYYGYTTDTYYVTTEGYAVQDSTFTNINTGAVVITHSTDEYLLTAIRMQNLVNKTSYIDFNYASYNFTVIRNVVPRLREVTFV